MIVVNNPPVNASSWEVRKELLEAIRAAATDHSSSAIGIIGAGKTFVAGSDIREFGKPLRDPQFPTVIEAIESCTKPVVAAIHGASLGGGFELARVFRTWRFSETFNRCKISARFWRETRCGPQTSRLLAEPAMVASTFNSDVSQTSEPDNKRALVMRAT
jgi:hypothetical protein